MWQTFGFLYVLLSLCIGMNRKGIILELVCNGLSKQKEKIIGNKRVENLMKLLR